jgi:hypothetical protein
VTRPITNYGAWVLARDVAERMRAIGSLARFGSDLPPFDPSHPPAPDALPAGGMQQRTTCGKLTMPLDRRTLIAAGLSLAATPRLATAAPARGASDLARLTAGDAKPCGRGCLRPALAERPRRRHRLAACRHPDADRLPAARPPGRRCC